MRRDLVREIKGLLEKATLLSFRVFGIMTILLERQKVQNQLLEIVLDFSHPIQETTVGYWIITLQALTFYLIRNGVSWTFGVPRWHCGKQRPHGSHSRPFFADGSQGSQLCRRHPEPHVADVAVPCVNSL